MTTVGGRSGSWNFFFYCRRNNILSERWSYLDNGSDSKESACNAGDLGLISGSGRSPWRRECNPLQYPCLGSPMDRAFWWTTIHGVATGWTRLSNTFHFHADHWAAEGKPGDTRDTLKQYLSDWGNGLWGTGRGAGLARCGESSLSGKPVHGHQGWLGSIVWKPVKFSSDWLDFLNKIGNKDLSWKNEV